MLLSCVSWFWLLYNGLHIVQAVFINNYFLYLAVTHVTVVRFMNKIFQNAVDVKIMVL